MFFVNNCLKNVRFFEIIPAFKMFLLQGKMKKIKKLFLW